jgi:hypothetical protein
VQATTEAELNMVAGLTGEAAAHRTLLDRLSGHLRAYFKGRLARIGRTGTEAEDLCPVWVRRTGLSSTRHVGVVFPSQAGFSRVNTPLSSS